MASRRRPGLLVAVAAPTAAQPPAASAGDDVHLPTGKGRFDDQRRAPDEGTMKGTILRQCAMLPWPTISYIYAARSARPGRNAGSAGSAMPGAEFNPEVSLLTHLGFN